LVWVLIWIAAAFRVNGFVFRWLGGFGSAGQAIERWGELAMAPVGAPLVVDNDFVRWQPLIKEGRAKQTAPTVHVIVGRAGV